uniref:Uncharacterized protein n=1 Tax=Arundo donax TaxID=35708 RepID=A0A0A9BS87_ARUDO
MPTPAPVPRHRPSSLSPTPRSRRSPRPTRRPPCRPRRTLAPSPRFLGGHSSSRPCSSGRRCGS